MNLDEYTRLHALDIARAVGTGELDPVEVVDAAISAIEAVNPTLNAVVVEDFDRARRAAAVVSRSAPLAGVPFLIKDVDIFASEWPTTHCSRFFAAATPRADSEIVRRWRAAGLIFLGKTNSPEFANDFTTEPVFRGATRNPYHAGVTAGGSSGGSAAAVASRMVPAAHGSDVGGSIRVPSACCGLFGLKPSRGLNPIGPYFGADGGGLNTEHVLTRTVGDSAALLDATAGPEPLAATRVERAVPSYLAALGEPASRLTIAYLPRRLDGSPVASEVATVVERTALQLESLGHTIEERRYPPDLSTAMAGDGWMLLWIMDIAYAVDERARELGRAPTERDIEPLARAMLERAARRSALDCMRARRAAHLTRVAMHREFDRFDLLLTPTTATPAAPSGGFQGQADPADFETWASASYAFAPFTEIFNVTGQPAASLPLGMTETGIPIGVQLVAKQNHDHLLLSVAAQLEAISDWARRRPTVWAGRSN
jgi:amidase